MEFRVIENAPPKYTERYEEFIELYNKNEISVKKIREKLDWTIAVYNQARTQALKENRLKDRRSPLAIKNVKGRPRKPKKEPKHYSQNSYGKYTVVKRFNDGKGKSNYLYCGVYNTEQEAKKMVEEMKKVNWDKNLLNEIRLRVVDNDR